MYLILVVILSTFTTNKPTPTRVRLSVFQQNCLLGRFHWCPKTRFSYANQAQKAVASKTGFGWVSTNQMLPKQPRML